MNAHLENTSLRLFKIAGGKLTGVGHRNEQSRRVGRVSDIVIRLQDKLVRLVTIEIIETGAGRF